MSAAPAPSPAEQATIDRFGIFDEENRRALHRVQFCEAIRGYSEDLWCAQWHTGIVDKIRGEGGIWLIHAARAQGWPIGLDGEDGWEPLTDAERDATVAHLVDLAKGLAS